MLFTLRQTYQREMQRPQMAFVSKQVILLAPAQAQSPSLAPDLPMLCAKDWAQAAPLAASDAADSFGSAVQLRYDRGLPKTMEMTKKLSRRPPSRTVMMKRPKWA